MKDSVIYLVLALCFPDWEPVPDRKTWNACHCPVHGDDNPSAAVSYELDAFNCMACGFSGNAITILMRKEKISFEAAEQRAEEMADGRHSPIPRKPDRKSGRRVFEG